MKKRFWQQILCLILVLYAAFSVQAQQSKTEIEKPKAGLQTVISSAQNFQLNSKLMARQIPYRVVLPVNYSSANEKTFYPVVYLLHGLTGHFDNWADKTKLKDYAKNYNYIIVMPEGNNGWYTDSATVSADKYESYIIQELIPEIEKKFRAKTGRENRAVAGLSMGGYGSIKFGLKYPEMFSLVGSFSGALGAASWSKENLGQNQWVASSIITVYGNAETATRKENDIFKLVSEMPVDKIKNLPFVYLDCGTEDFLYKSNREFANLLQERRIPHEFRELPGVHNWVFWDSQISEFLELTAKFLK